MARHLGLKIGRHRDGNGSDGAILDQRSPIAKPTRNLRRPGKLGRASAPGGGGTTSARVPGLACIPVSFIPPLISVTGCSQIPYRQHGRETLARPHTNRPK